MKLKETTEAVCDIVQDVAAFIRTGFAGFNKDEIREKGIHNYVTDIDTGSEQRLKERLGSLLPEAGFLAEESNPDCREEFNWIIDPLDGTTNFIHGIPLFAISVALMKKRDIVCGVVYEVNQGACFYAWKGGGAWLNGRPIHVSETSSLNNGLFATGFPYYDYSRLTPYVDFFRYLIRNSRGARRLGSASVDLAWVACGRFEGFYEYGLSPWDVAAGALLVTEAGGLVCDFEGHQNHLFGKEIIATNAKIHSQFLKTIKTFF
ncbi:MAG: inositol monophosphatase [Bacteroidetes bacterium]|nr:inositol monophosphatase [Bacteroidota bacterium]